jgi:CRISPR/Cas system-associated exonuclease Cas4 (RecB family)
MSEVLEDTPPEVDRPKGLGLDVTNSPVLSASGITLFLRCPKAYLYSNVFRVPGLQNLAAAIGVATHAGVAALFSRPLRPLEALRREFAAETVNVPASELAADSEALSDAERMLEVYRKQVAPTFSPTMVEKEFLIEVDGLRLSGTLDAADEKTDEVRDLKTRSGKTINGKKPSAFDPAKHQVQLSLYGIAYRAMTGRAPKRLLLDVLTRTGKYKQYEVKPDYGGMLEAAHLTADAILRAEYPPSGALSNACGFCSFREICPDVSI